MALTAAAVRKGEHGATMGSHWSQVRTGDLEEKTGFVTRGTVFDIGQTDVVEMEVAA